MDVTDYAVRYTLDEGTGSASADSAGNVADASLRNGAGWSLDTPSQKGFALEFDGSNDSLDIPDDADINDYNGSRDNYSLSIWFKADDVSVNDHQPIYEEGGTVNGLNIYLINGTLYAGAWSEGSSWNGAWASTGDVTSGTWHHAVLTLDDAAGELKLYLDGELKDTQIGEGVEGHGGDVAIGRVNGNTKFHDIGDSSSNDYYGGLADDLRVYHYTLNATQVAGIEMAGGPQMPHPDPADGDRRMEHMALFSILKRTEATHAVVGDGDWSDSSIWMDGQVPGAGAKVVVVDGRTVTYDVNDSTTALEWVRVDGTLTIDPDTDTAMLVETLAVDPIGTINIGTSSNSINPNNTAEIIIDTTGGPIDQTWDTFAFTRGAVFHGVTNIYGAVKKAHTTLDGDALANAGVIKLSDSSIPSGWQVGDTLVVAGTEVDTSLLNVGNKKTEIEDGDAENSRFKDEILEITAMNVVNGHVEVSFNNITNDTAIGNNRTTLLWDHKRPSGATFSADELAIHVANLTRNIVFRSSDPSVDLQERGHTMVMHNPNANIQYAQFKDLGRTDKRKLIDDTAAQGNFDGSAGTGTNPRGRYSIHLHKAGTAGTKAVVEGNVVWGNPGWSIVHHDSFADLTENVVFDGVGAGIIAEDGNETGKWTRNLVIKMRGDLENNFDDNFFLGNGRTAMFDFGFNGSGYWVQGGGVRLILEDNVAASINGAGIDVFNTMDGDPRRLKLPVSEVADASLRQALLDDGYSEVTVNNLPMETHSGTVVYNAYRGIFSWLHMRNSLNGKEFAFTFGTRVGHEFRSSVSDFKIWNVLTGVQNFYSTRIDYSNGLVVGNVNNPVPFDGSSQANNTEGVGFTHNGNNANYHNFDGMRVEGFDYGFAVFRSLASNGEESPYAVSSLTNSQFANVNYALSPTSNSTEPYSDLFILDEASTFSTLLDGSNQDPTATFTSSAAGGYAVNLDASGSSDPDPLSYTQAGDDGIAAFAWDLDNDGQYDDAWGDKPLHIFPGAGTYPVAVKIWDGNGATDTYSTNVSVSATAYANPLINGDFSAGAPSETNWYGSIDSGDRGAGWIMGEGQFVLSGGQLLSDQSYSRSDERIGVGQVIRDEYVRKGDQTLSIDFLNSEVTGAANKLYVRVYGVNSRFERSSLRRLDPPEEVEQYAFSSTTLLQTDVGGSSFGWTNYSWTLDFGGGYEYIVVQVTAEEVDGPGGDQVGIDNVSLTGDAPAGGATAPMITGQPADGTRYAGESITFSTSVTGNPAPSFQWRLNGSDISGATNDSLTLNNVTAADAGDYTLFASNSAGDDTSDPAALTVISNTGLAGLTGAIIGSGDVFVSRELTGGDFEQASDAGGIDDLGNGQDSIIYDYESVEGDFEAVLQIKDLQGGSNARAGLMLREGVDNSGTREPAAGDAFIFLGTEAGSADGYVQQYRDTTNAAANSEADTQIGGSAINHSFPDKWVMLKREGDLVTLFTSSDGVSFTEVDVSYTISGLNQEVLIGVAAWSGDGTTAIGQYDGYTLAKVQSTQVSASTDDAEEKSGGTMQLSSGDLDMGDKPHIGMRFTGLQIPQGASITRAYIQFVADQNGQSSTSSVTIKGEDTDDASAFTSSNGDITGRVQTSASVGWNIPAWTTNGESGLDQQTPDLTGIVQEIVDRGGWQSGNDLVIFVEGSSGKRSAKSYNTGSSVAPILEIHYQD